MCYITHYLKMNRKSQKGNRDAYQTQPIVNSVSLSFSLSFFKKLLIASLSQAVLVLGFVGFFLNFYFSPPLLSLLSLPAFIREIEIPALGRQELDTIT